MARTAKPWYRKDRDEWCVTLGGKRVVLVKGKKNHREAYRRFVEIGGNLDKPVTSREASRDVCSLFVEHARLKLKPKTHHRYKQFLEPFAEFIGAIDGNGIEPRQVTRYLETKSNWNNTTQYGFIGAVKRAWAWAKDEGHITVNPLEKMKRPKPNRREDIPDDEGVASFIEAATGGFKEVLIFIYETGCRPGEAFMLERRHVDLTNAEIRFKIGEDKTSWKTGKQRIIHLSPSALHIVTKLCALYPTGPLFHNARGGRWTPYACNKAVRRIRSRANLDNRSAAYALRHHWATDGLARGLSVPLIAEMMGNSPAIVASTYSHLSDQKAILMEAAQKVRPGKNNIA